MAGAALALAASSLLASAQAAPRTAAAAQSYVADPATSWAVLVGVSHYNQPTHPTYGGDGDVAAFHTLLNQAGWSDSHILILTEQAAPASQIRQAIHWLVAHSAQNTFSLFHYSGHVYQSGGHEFMWGVDNNFIRDDEFSALLNPIAGRAWIDVSGCEAAGFDRGLSGPYRFFTASSMTNEKSYEDPDWHESVWTGLTVDQGMVQHQAGGRPLSIQSAVAWSQPQASQMTASQQPHGPQHPYAVGGDMPWYIGPPYAPPPPAAPPAAPKTPPPADLCTSVSFGKVRCGSIG
ncbi:MAG: caspase family protein [Acidimicrobiales bacterium]